MSNLALIFNNAYADTVTKNFKSFLDSDLYIDLIFVCRNNKKVGAHQIVMGCISKFFYSMFLENVNTVKEKVIHVYVPDIRAKIMKRILDFVYCGKAKLIKTELSEFKEDIKLLGMPLDVFTSSNEVDAAGKSSASVTDNGINSTNTTLLTCTPNSNVDPATSVIPPVTGTLDNFNVSSDFLAHSQNESVVSSSNTSVPVPPDLAIPHLTNSNSILNKTPASGLPVIVDAHSLSNVRNLSSLPGSSTVRNINSTNLNVLRNNSDTDSKQITNNIPNQGRTNSSTTPHKKKRKLTGLQATDFINLDSDDEKADDVITLS